MADNHYVVAGSHNSFLAARKPRAMPKKAALS